MLKCGDPMFVSVIDWNLDHSLDMGDCEADQYKTAWGAIEDLKETTIDDGHEPGEDPCDIEGYVYWCIPVAKIKNGQVVDQAQSPVEMMARAATALELNKGS